MRLGARSYGEALHPCVLALVPVGDRFHFLWTQSELWEDATVAKEVARHDAELSQLIDDAKSEGTIDRTFRRSGSWPRSSPSCSRRLKPLGSW